MKKLSVFTMCCLVGGCTDMTDDYGITGSEKVPCRVCLAPSTTKAIDPDEYVLNDVNLFVFNEHGVLEEKLYIENYHNVESSGGIDIRLVKNCKYDVYACANIGYKLNVSSIAELLAYRYYIAYPDDYHNGLPMSGTLRFKAGEDEQIVVPLLRLFAKVSLRMDRSRLNPDVEMNIVSLKTGGCPKSVSPFASNVITDTDDFFPAGFIRSEGETDRLNTRDFSGKSDFVTLYLLENMQGDLLPENTYESEKYFAPTDTHADFCSYVEIRIEYLSTSVQSIPGEYLIYRFYIGKSPSNFDVCRNTDYIVTISPTGDGLGDDNWRIDHDGISERIESINLNYSKLKMTYTGENVQLEAYISPELPNKPELSWSSTDTAIASVDPDGNVTAKSEGKCEILCSLADDTGYYSCTNADSMSDGRDKEQISGRCEITVKFSPYFMKVYPGNFIKCKKGDKIQVHCDYFPPNTDFDIGTEELEYDKERGIYDYAIGNDGKSVTLYTKERGSGLLYMETGSPVNEAELIVVVVD